MTPVAIVLSGVGEGNRGRNGGGNLLVFHIGHPELSHRMPLGKINVCLKNEKTRSRLKTSGREKEFTWSCLMVSWVWGDVAFNGNF
jgi:hypothetical protein